MNTCDDKNLNQFTEDDRKILLGVMVKMFYVPLMTVFFFDQFSHMIHNVGFISQRVSDSSGFRLSITDFYNILFTLLLSIDVGLAWCGYAISSRWIRNTNVSVEPTFLGWFVAIVCYPPFNGLLSTYFMIPPEKGFLNMSFGFLVILFSVLSILSYCIYVSATAVFGLRFSNLTHRGIITNGPYAFVRHPAYAAKNFSWWCVMMPFAAYQTVTSQNIMYLTGILGLAGMTLLYYFRAVTEERHLSIDPAYREYCQKVPYRFIPGIW